MKKSPVLFLDRDGTVNVDLISEYVSDPDQIKLIPSAGKAIVRAARAGFKISIITNQAGVAKGFTPVEALPRIHSRLEELIAKEAKVPEFKFDDVQVCIHHPNDKCGCRKPEPGSLRASMEKLSADPEKSYFIGDKSGDLICAARMGVKSILVLTGHGEETRQEIADHSEANPIATVKDLMAAVELILLHENR